MPYECNIFKVCKVCLSTFSWIYNRPPDMSREKRTFGLAFVSTWQRVHVRLQQTGWSPNAFSKRIAFMCHYETHEQCIWRSWAQCMQGLVQMYCVDEETYTDVCLFLVYRYTYPKGEKQFSEQILTTIILFSDYCYCTKLVCKTVRWGNSLLLLRVDQVALS